jgi:mitochondrial import inner membrane translocase subunit TIM54
VDAETVPTTDEIIMAVRQKNGTPEYEGTKGDIVIGRNTWKEYIRGVHEGWLGPLSLPPDPPPVSKIDDGEALKVDGSDDAKSDEAKEEEPKPKRPLQLRPHNTVDDYPASSLPLLIPAEFDPVAPISLPHILGFLNTPTRMRRFFNRRALADNIGREVAAACLCTYREFRELPEPQKSSRAGEELQYEQQLVLRSEERDWLKSVWKEKPEDQQAAEHGGASAQAEAQKELIWPKPVVLDSRIATRMRRFELQPEDETRARAIVVPEEEIEGWIKGSFRSMARWGVSKVSGQQKKPIPLDDEDA